jgi:hypothetical protein
MPDASGILTVQDHQKIQSWWSQHWKSPVVCPVCKTTEWSTANHVVNIHRYAADALAPFTIAYPHIIVGCKNCGHGMFFNAVMIGIPGLTIEELKANTNPAVLAPQLPQTG